MLTSETWKFDNRMTGAQAIAPAHGPYVLKLVTMLCAIAFAMFAAAFVLAVPAYANIQLDAPTTVSDDITRVHVNKLDADTHDYIVGATMQIIEKDTGLVIDEWVSGDGETHKYEKGELVVDRVYILRELAAPDGYTVVDDVEFVVNEMEGRGLDIVAGTAGQYEQTGANVITLYDEPLDTENEIIVTETRGTPAAQQNNTVKAVAPKTGDETPLYLIAALVVTGIAVILLLQIPKRKME